MPLRPLCFAPPPNAVALPPAGPLLESRVEGRHTELESPGHHAGEGRRDHEGNDEGIQVGRQLPKTPTVTACETKASPRATAAVATPAPPTLRASSLGRTDG